MLSRDSSYTGSREKPDSAAVSRTVSRSELVSAPMMSVRGVITSRTVVRVRPNTPWIIACSSSSTTPSSRLCWTSNSISSGL